MRTFYSDRQRLHAPAGEFNRGRLVQPFERPERAERLIAAVREAGISFIEEPAEFPLTHAQGVHDPQYVSFIQGAYAEWLGDGREGDALPIAWAIRGLRSDRVPHSIDGKLAYYSFDGMTPIMSGTWAAVSSAMNVALGGASLIASGQARAAFSLCRPPGHHAATDYFGGYCFLNNAAIAAQYFRDQGAARVAVLDVDYHHGNGTQEIFYKRSDVLYASIHADPATDFPYFLGYADETGAGVGEGCNRNFPLARGADWSRWSEALEAACAAVTAFGPDVLVVSLGVDTLKGDPLAAFALDSEDFLRIGERIAQLDKPTHLVMEGGYAMDEIGVSAVNVLRGYESRAAR
jgi:acetoin utilization deacetylase AcuC-like enzyme